MDGRMLGPAGAGVATYARAVAAAQSLLSAEPFILDDERDRSRQQGTPARLRRWLRAALPFPVRAREVANCRLVAPDLFRLAQVHFDIFGRLLTVRPASAGGIMHWTYPLPIRLAGWTNVYTVHDAIPLLQPELTRIDAKRHERLLRQVAASADAIVTVSEAARNDLLRIPHFGPRRVVDCSQPVTVSPKQAPPPAGLPPRGYLVVVGTVEPRKNIAGVIRGYAASGVTLPLVIAGGAMPGAEALESLIASTPGTVRLPYLERSAVEALIAGARALLMPSLAEGFGLPVAEAMMLGTPVVTSANGAVAETSGGATLLVDPLDPLALAEAIRRIASDDRLWKELSDRGRVSAARFTPERFAARLGSLYADLIAGTGHDL